MKIRLNIKDNISEIGSFALPIFVEQAAIAFMTVISAILVSRISTYAISGVSLVESLNILIQQIFMSLEIGATVVVAQYCGRGDSKSASETTIQAMLTSVSIAIFISILMLIFPDQVLGIILGKAQQEVYEAGRIYFIFAVFSFPFLSIYAITTASIRGSGNPKLSLIGVIVTNVSFVLLGLIFINVFNMGVAGAGLALLISRVLGAGVGIFLLKKGNNMLVIENWIPKKIQWHIQKSILIIGIPACIESMIFLAGRLTTQTYTVALGTQAMAINALSNSVAMFYNIPGSTAASISVPIVGKYIGMRNRKSAIESSRIVILLSIFVMGCLSIILAIFARPFAYLFTSDPKIIDGIVFISRTNFVVSPIVWTLSFVIPSILRASGDMKYTTTVSIVSMVMFRMTIGYLLAIVLNFGVIGIWIGMYVDWSVRAIMFTIRYLKGKWVELEILYTPADSNMSIVE